MVGKVAGVVFRINLDIKVSNLKTKDLQVKHTISVISP